MQPSIYFFIALLIFSTFLLNLSQAAESQIFTDIPPTNPYYQATKYLQEHDILSGYSDGTFQPEREVNRAEFTKIILNSQFSETEIENCQGNGNFSDISFNTWYGSFVCLAQAKAIIQGYPDGTFRPEQNINFVEAAKIIVGTLSSYFPAEQIPILEFPEYLNTTADGEIIDHNPWYRPFVTKISDKQAIPLTIQSLEQRITRGELAEIIWRIKTENEAEPSLLFAGTKIVGEATDKQELEESYNLLLREIEEVLKADFTLGNKFTEFRELANELEEEIVYLEVSLEDPTAAIAELKATEEPKLAENYNVLFAEANQLGSRFEQLQKDKEELRTWLRQYYCVQDTGFNHFELYPKDSCDRKSFYRGLYCNAAGELSFDLEKCSDMEHPEIVPKLCFRDDRKIALIEFVLPGTDTSNQFFNDPIYTEETRQKYADKDWFYFLNNQEQLEFDYSFLDPDFDEQKYAENPRLSAELEYEKQIFGSDIVQDGQLTHKRKIYSLYKIPEKFEEEASRYGRPDIDVELEIFGPYQLESIPTYMEPGGTDIDDILEIKKIVNEHLSAAEQVNYDLVHPILFYSNDDSLFGYSTDHATCIKQSSFREPNHITTVIHEISHNFCASDLYARNGVGGRFEGLVEPFKESLFPQKYKSFMGWNIQRENPRIFNLLENLTSYQDYLNYKKKVLTSLIALTLDQVRFSPYTAYKFGWIPDWENWREEKEKIKN